jgi:hypothetical protein
MLTQARSRNGLSTARVLHAAKRVLAIADFSVVLQYSHGCFEENCFDARPKPSRLGGRYPESAVPEDVEVEVSAAGRSAFGK